MASTSKQLVVGGAGLVLAIAGALVTKYEGHSNAAYWDPYGKVWTICDGHTGPEVHKGLVWDDAQCKAALDHDLSIARAAVHRCLPVPMLVQIDAALTDGAYNLGEQVVCGSTLQRKALANDWPGACAELYRWDKAAGRVLPGLTRRRTDEAHLCEGRALWSTQ